MKCVLPLTCLLFLVSCGPSSNSEPPTNEKKVREADFPGTWPFIVNEGVLRCEADAVTLETGGVVYAVNGTAKGRKEQYGWRDVREIWAIDTALTNGMVRVGVPYDKAEVRMNIAPVIEQGLALCKKR